LESLVSGGVNIQYITAFGEDLAGNLYIVKFGNGLALLKTSIDL
jgi:hypothetical protein